MADETREWGWKGVAGGLAIGFAVGAMLGLGAGYYWSYHEVKAWSDSITSKAINENRVLREELQELRKPR